MSSDQAIGVFDSGVGGLTVAREIFKQLPEERIIYFGDTAHVPYGSRPVEELVGLARNIMDYLVGCGVKAIVVACNTSSSVAIDKIAYRYNVPIIGVVKPGAGLAVQSTKNKKIGVIATEATINSGAYNKAIKALAPDVEVFGQACPMFVPLVESGKFDTPETYYTADSYLKPLREAGVDTLIFGCTHYPYLEKVVKDIMGPEVKLVDPAAATVAKTSEVLQETEQLSERLADKHRFLVSGDPKSFKIVGSRLVGDMVKEVGKRTLK